MAVRAAELEVGVTVDGVSAATAQIGGLSSSINAAGAASLASAAHFSRLGFLLGGLGAAFAGAGAAGLGFYRDSVDAAIAYNQSAAHTLTQVREIGVSLEDIKRIGREVAQAIPAPFEQMQEALFDIFSTTDIGVEDARKALEVFAKAAVAGQVDIRTAARGSIDMMNAFGLTASDLSRILDIQFKIVQLGKGEYIDVANNIGRASTSAVRAGQSLDEFAGVAAFVSRFLPSMGNTVASVGRAFDAFANPKVVERLRAMGVAAVDAAGNFRPISDVMVDLGRKMADLTKPERAEALANLFKGAGGTIQARRFFDIAIEQFDTLDKMVDNVANSAGAMQQAYDIMLVQPQTMIQDLKNEWEVLRTEIGDMFIPKILALVRVGQSLIEWFRDLSPGIQQAILLTGFFLSALGVIAGVILIVVGAFLALTAVVVLVTGTLVGAMATAGLIVGALLLIPVAIFLLIRHWDSLKNVVLPVWEAIKGAVLAGVNFIRDLIMTFVGVVVDAWKGAWANINQVIIYFQALVHNVATTVGKVFDELFGGVTKGLSRFSGSFSGFSAQWQRLEEILTGVFKGIADGVMKALRFLNNIWLEHSDELIAGANAIRDAVEKAFFFIATTVVTVAQAIGEHLRKLAQFWAEHKDEVFSVFQSIGRGIQAFFGIISDIAGVVVRILSKIGEVWRDHGDKVVKFIQVAFDLVSTIIMDVLNWILPIIQRTAAKIADLWAWLRDNTQSIWEGLGNIIRFAIGLIAGIIGTLIKIVTVVLQVIKAAWDLWGDDILRIISGIWDAIVGVVMGAIKVIVGIIKIVIGIFTGDWKGIWEGIKAIFEGVWNAIVGIAKGIWGVIVGLLGIIFSPIIDIWNAIWGGIVATFNLVWGAISSTASAVWGFLTDLFFTVWGAISDFFSSIWESISSVATTVWQAISDFFSSIWGGIKDFFISVWEGIMAFIKPILRFWEVLFAVTLGAIFIIFAAIWTVIKEVVLTVWNALKDAAIAIWNPIRDFFSAVMDAIKTVVTTVWNAILGFILPLWESIKLGAINIWNAVRDFFVGLWEGIKTAALAVWTVIKDSILRLWEDLKSGAINIWNAVKDFFVGLWNGIKDIALTVWNTIKDFLVQRWENLKANATTAWEAIKGAITGPFNAVKDTITSALETIKEKWNAAWDTIKSKASGIWEGISSAIKGGVNAIIRGLNSGIRVAEKFINTLIRAYNKVAEFTPGLGTVNPVNFSEIPLLGKGGILKSPQLVIAGDVPEAIIPLSQLDKFGGGKGGSVVIEQGAFVIHVGAGADQSVVAQIKEQLSNFSTELVKSIKQAHG